MNDFEISFDKTPILFQRRPSFIVIVCAVFLGTSFLIGATSTVYYNWSLLFNYPVDGLFLLLLMLGIFAGLMLLSIVCLMSLREIEIKLHTGKVSYKVKVFGVLIREIILETNSKADIVLKKTENSIPRSSEKVCTFELFLQNEGNKKRIPLFRRSGLGISHLLPEVLGKKKTFGSGIGVKISY